MTGETILYRDRMPKDLTIIEVTCRDRRIFVQGSTMDKTYELYKKLRDEKIGRNK